MVPRIHDSIKRLLDTFHTFLTNITPYDTMNCQGLIIKPMNDTTQHDQLPTKETTEGNTLETIESTYSSSAVVPKETLEKVNGETVDLSKIKGDTPEEKRANLQAEIEKNPSAHLILNREVGPFQAEVRRGWNEAEQTRYESIMVKEATKTVDLPGFGNTTLKDIRVGRNEGPKEDVPFWGSAEFTELAIKRPPDKSYADQLESALDEIADGATTFTKRTFEFEGNTIILEASSDPANIAKWGGEKFHIYTDIAYEDKPEIFRAILPSLSLGRNEPDERPLAGYAMNLKRISVDLSKTTGTIGRTFFEYRLIDKSEVSKKNPNETPGPESR
jgi:hypothetical protein